MKVENGIRILAGTMVLISLLLTTYVSHHFVWFTVFIGLNLIQSGFTGFCPPRKLLLKLGLKE
ncbi:YgaP family membrane protein [Vibrio parahaemolyticus]|uniref:YgaP family membrane protein n=1 Tax=Vibrio mediterranei TaxID=689 RepID=UPI00406875A6